MSTAQPSAEQRRDPRAQVPPTVYDKRVTILPKKDKKQPGIPLSSWIVLVLMIGVCVTTFWFFHGIVLAGWVRWSISITWLLGNLGMGYYDFAVPSKKPKDAPPTDSVPIDRWTLAHTGSGIILGVWWVPLWAVLVLTIAWEIFEMKSVGFGDKETFKNRAVDVGVALVGWLLVVIIVMGTTVPNASFPLLSPKP